MRTFFVVLATSVSTAVDTGITLLNKLEIPNEEGGQKSVLFAYPDVDTTSELYKPYFALGVSVWVLFAIFIFSMITLLNYYSTLIAISSHNESQESFLIQNPQHHLSYLQQTIHSLMRCSLFSRHPTKLSSIMPKS
jgi:hypothetical protein